MRKFLNLFILLLMFSSLAATSVAASSTTDSYSAEYENGFIEVAGSVDSDYAGMPATVSLRLKSDSMGFPLYFNDTIVGRDGKISLSFPYEIENVNEYFVRLNVAAEYTEDIYFSDEEIVYESNSVSDFVYYSEDEWHSLSYDSYADITGKKVTVGATVPEKYQSKCVVFTAKDNTGRLCSVSVGEAYAENKYKALLDIPQNGIVEIYCWDSLNTIKPYYQKVSLPWDCQQTITFAENPEPIAENPGKGWVRYRSDYAESEDVLQYVSVGYNRFNWNQIEIQEGVYDWSVIDEFINKWDLMGKKAAFGIACASSTNSASYLTPKWVFDAGAKYTMANNGTQFVPVWNDEIFLSKLENFTKALALRYDGDPRIAFIDVRSYGNFGETHTSELSGSVALSANDEKRHIDIAAKYFKQTQLMICTANTAEQGIKTEYAVNKGIGLRSDSILSGNYSEIHKLDDAYAKEPTVFEFVNSYGSMKSAADNYGSPSNDNGHWNEERYLLSFFTGKPSYMDLGQYNNDSQSFVNDNRELIELLSNKMGYHFVLKEMSLPVKIDEGKAFTLNAEWVNKGVTPLYEECYPAIALLDENNRVIDKCWLDGFSPKNWLPNTDVTDSAEVKFSAINGDSVKLAIGLFSKKTDSSPSYRIGNYNSTDDKWYIVANGIKGDDGYNLTPYSQPQQLPLNTKLDDFYAEKMAVFSTDEATDNIISDSAFELDGHNWHPVKNLSIVKKSTSSPHSGSYCGVISERSDMWSGAQIDITELLKQNGAGTYRFEGWFRTTGILTSRKLTVYPFRINSVTEYTISAEINNSWSEVTGDIEISQEQIDKMTHAVTLILGDDRGSYYNSKDIYFDDITLTKIN